MTEVIAVKKKRERKIPPFSHINFKGKVKKIPFQYTSNMTTVEEAVGRRLVMCPFTEYIPVSYVTEGIIPNYFYSVNNDVLKRKLPLHKQTLENIGILRKRYSDNMSDIICRICYSTDRKEDAKARIGNILYNEHPVGINPNPGWHTNRTAHIMDSFRTRATYLQAFTAGDDMGVTNRLGLFIQRDGIMVPIIVMVVHKKNLLYQRLHFLLRGELDLSKCMLFVDRELDSPSVFPEKAFRANIWMKHILPWIKTLDIDVWKVPASFIEENCFMPQYKVKGKTVEEKRKEKEEMVKIFMDRIKAKYGDSLNNGPRATVVGSSSPPLTVNMPQPPQMSTTGITTASTTGGFAYYSVDNTEYIQEEDWEVDEEPTQEQLDSEEAVVQRELPPVREGHTITLQTGIDGARVLQEAIREGIREGMEREDLPDLPF